ncbi:MULTISPECIES: TetR/AcrR family transcriptional regulator [Catenuloplanes]|uniref:AcrR family transcriptional regulator n=1 Tax=Catenuloplanes niger TaxID=587534 RepID=A0AAE3ZMB1_9ACTN|nr:TetR family transcriptional regulator [Catenuloplanes niger]MDR7322402.1 AcrR family transcriptional regulator [Catenuloplanes niger]
MPEPVPSRLARRKQETRAALIAAAQRIYAERGTTDVSIQQITEAADVGFGSFYNHFTSKADLFDAAVAEAVDAHAARLSTLLADIDDPAAVFTTSLRITGRTVRTHPLTARIMTRTNSAWLLLAERGHAPRALQDISAAVEAGVFRIGDPAVALACTAGCLIAAMQLCGLDPEMPVDRIIDEAALNVLRMFRVEEAEAERLVALPLPPVTT